MKNYIKYFEDLISKKLAAREYLEIIKKLYLRLR